MNTLRYTLTLLTVLCLLCGCASYGRKFDHQNTALLKLGQTRSSEYEQMFGIPDEVQTKDTPDGHFETVEYTYAWGTLTSATARFLSLEFREGVLNAYLYASSFHEDKTNVDAKDFGQIQVGVSKRSNVLEILGEPHGMALSPTHLRAVEGKYQNENEVWIWRDVKESSRFGDEKDLRRDILVTFDKEGFVTNFDSSQTVKR